MKASASAAAHDDGKHAFWIGHDESKGGLNLASPLLRSLSFAKQKAEIMCGIVGYVGKQKASAIILEGLKRLEYRGYDSAGICVQHGRSLDVAKKAGRVDNLAKLSVHQKFTGTT
ncbi:MAG TPA: hypothetical protein VEA63_04320, partial [Opitutus sp.]|nr:hypothetical protein [Opitutus sp.]